jgi:hypothetical protein
MFFKSVTISNQTLQVVCFRFSECAAGGTNTLVGVVCEHVYIYKQIICDCEVVCLFSFFYCFNDV